MRKLKRMKNSLISVKSLLQQQVSLVDQQRVKRALIPAMERAGGQMSDEY